MPEKFMKTVSLATVLGTIAAACLYYQFGWELVLTLAITLGTIAYHFCMRLLVGACFQHFMGNRADYTRKWYQPRSWEGKCYRFLRVKEWKNKMPTYHTEIFSAKEHTWDEIAQAMCQSELVHETDMVLSFLPLLAAIPFESFLVFLITSLAAALMDLVFVIIQRYNRPRVVKIVEKQRQRSGAENISRENR